jgi:hypothetical protein
VHALSEVIVADGIDFIRSFPEEIAALPKSANRQSGPLPPLSFETDQSLFASTPRPSDLSTRPSIRVTAPYDLPALRVGPPETSQKPPSLAVVSPVTSPDRTRNGPMSFASPTRSKSPIPSPTRDRSNPLATLGNRLSFAGSNKSNDTLGPLGASTSSNGNANGDMGSVNGSMRKKGNRLSRLGSFMKRG